MVRVFLDGYERTLSNEAVSRAAEHGRTEVLEYENAIRQAREGNGPHPYLVTSIVCETTAEYQKRKREEEGLDHEELRVLKFLRGEIAS